MPTSALTSYFKYNSHVINANLKNVSHEESVTFPPNGGNCINWVLGHLVVTRDNVLQLLNLSPLCSEEMVQLYERGSSMTDPAQAHDVEQLLSMYNQAHEHILSAIDNLDEQKREQLAPDLAGLAFHEAYHAGQLGVLRRVIGKEGVLG